MSASSPKFLAVVLIALAAACGGKRQPATTAAPPSAPAAFPSAGPVPPAPGPPPAVSPVPLADTPIASTPLLPWDAQPLDVINGPDSPLKAVLFKYDSDELTPEAKQALETNAALLKTYPTWVVTIEGHCDERGTAEYNLALGDRRALAAKTYLVSLGVGPDRIRTVSYGNEFPFDPGHTESAWSQNRRAHFMLTSK
ncbi:MAG: peptidoglycan-associated lipoprotein Pal [Acidobacteria bacterium]|nr:peptidoglycan-associated lipoprotein Pal [Acidobacteriota bacterium]